MNPNNILKLFIYYILILVGLSTTSWIIWSRFIRERIIREIPDGTFTEYRFWVLLYICCVYLYIIKNLVKPKEANEFILWITNQLYLPMKMLDHLVKYNIYITQYYTMKMTTFIEYICCLTDYQKSLYVYAFEIIPRIILILFLCIDVFYFNKIELFYKVVLIGILPFFFKYITYSLKDLYKTWINRLEHKYQCVFIFEEGYEGQMSRKRDTLAEYHYTKKSIKEYIDIKYDNWISYLKEEINYQYTANVFCKEDVYEHHGQNKYNNTTTALTKKDYEELNELFYETIPLILTLRFVLSKIEDINKKIYIRYPKIIIFILYLICWSFILIVSYWAYPVEFHLFKYFCSNIILYLILPDDQFSLLDGYSVNENCFTMEKMKYLLKKIYKIFQND